VQSFLLFRVVDRGVEWTAGVNAANGARGYTYRAATLDKSLTSHCL